MELTNLKRIKNENLKSSELPKYSLGTPGDNQNGVQAEGADPNGAQAASKINPWFALGAWAGGGVLSGLNALKNANEFIAEAGTSNASVGGIGYSELNNINANKYMKEYDKGTAMSFLTNPFEGITRLFGRGDLEEKIHLALASIAINNSTNRAIAGTLGLQLKAAQRNGNPQALLSNCRDGKGTEYSGGWARVSNGEAIVRGDLVIGRVPGLPNFKDGVIAYIGDDGVISNHQTIPGLRNSEYAIMTNDVAGALALDNMWRTKHGKNYKNGKLPGFKEGLLGNLIPSGLGALASIGLYIDASNQDIRSPQIYSANTYGQSALNDLASLRVNQYPVINLINNATARADHALNLSGGLSGYLRSRMRTANLFGTLKNIADAVMNTQMLNNLYKALLASAKMQLGENDAKRMLQARMFNEEMLAKSHAARLQGKQMGMFNFLNLLLSYYANEFKRRQFNDTMDLYRLQQNLDKARFDSELARYNDSKKQGVYLTPNLALPMMNMLLKYYGVG